MDTGTFAARTAPDDGSPGRDVTESGRLLSTPAAEGGRVLSPGRNCWRLSKAEHATVLIDAAAYFARLRAALETAERSILIIGWDFDHRIHLEPENGPQLGAFLRSLVEQRPDLHLRILIWGTAPIHGPGSTKALLFGAEWHDHPRIDVRLDRSHSFYACHHQKIVCIDDTVGFAGGMDLTVRRWDTRRHAPRSRRRVDPEGEEYPPVHDVQMLVTGEAARDLAGIARSRWAYATGETIAPLPLSAIPSTSEAAADFAELPVAIARGGSVATSDSDCHEVAALTVDCIAAAQRWLYIESQYFTSRLVGEALLRSLSAPAGPEIVVVLTHRSTGMMEQLVMGKNRERLLRKLRRADRHRRLRCYFPVVPGPHGAREVQIHSKVMVADDRLLRVGSANLNNRSLHLDSECDLAVEAASPADRNRVAEIRNRLLAEHLGAAPADVASILDETGSVFAVIDRLNQGPRGLRTCKIGNGNGPTRPIPFTWLLDPSHPIGRGRGSPFG